MKTGTLLQLSTYDDFILFYFVVVVVVVVVFLFFLLMEALLTEPKVTINPLLHDQRIDYFLPICIEFGLYRQASRG